MAEGNHSFTEQDIRKRFGAIVGHTVTEVDTAGVLTASAASRNKGRIGVVIEQSVLGYPADSDRRPDIVIDGQPWEVKATGLKESARGGWCAKEPMSITAVAPEGIVTESFSTSAFWHKAERLLVVYYLYVRPGRGVAVEYAGFEFKGYDLHTWREVDRCRLEADWTVVRDFVRIALAGDVDAEMPNLSTLINPQLLYLDTSPKWPTRQTAASASSRATSPASASGSMTSRSMASATDSTASSFPLSAISARTPTTAAASGFPPLSMISTSRTPPSSRKCSKRCAASGGRTGRVMTSSTRLSTSYSPPSANARLEHFETGAVAWSHPSLRKA